MKKFGIWQASGEFKKIPERAWDVVENDAEIDKPLEVFDSEQEAVEQLKNKYSSFVQKMTYHMTTYRIEVYFVAEAVKYDEDGDYTPDNLMHDSDGIEVTPIIIE